MSISSWLNNVVSRLPYGSSCGSVYLVFLIILVILGFYWVALFTMYGYSQVNRYDLLNHNVLTTPLSEKPLSFWPISHFLLFFLLGLLFPDCAVLIITIGVLWEVFEVIMGKLLPMAGGTAQGNMQYGGNWWGGNFQDIVMDIAGFFVGVAFAKTLPALLGVPIPKLSCC